MKNLATSKSGKTAEKHGHYGNLSFTIENAEDNLRRVVYNCFCFLFFINRMPL